MALNLFGEVAEAESFLKVQFGPESRHAGASVKYRGIGHILETLTHLLPSSVFTIEESFYVKP